ncbi:MAG: AzlD domain-containing protein [Clostridia bacterium]|nr:AzlD domain-containing protein [Clostridia bacterium]
MTDLQLFLTVALCALTTAGIRFAPFLLFPRGKQPPRFITWLGAHLPRAVMAMILVYCLKDVHFAGAAGWIPAFAGVAVTAALHVWRRQMSLSIIGGTAVYMVLIRWLGA